jgi:hypothetical protein
MDEKRKIDFVIRATDDASPTLDRVGKRMKEIQRGLEEEKIDKLARQKLGLEGSGFFPGLEGLKHTLGGRGSLKEIVETLAGGGAVAGLSRSLDVFAEMTHKIVEVSDAFHRGELSSGAFFEKIASSLPILGKAWDVGRNVRELITHEERDIRELDEALAKQTETLAANNKMWADAIKSRQEYQKISEEIIRSTDAATAQIGTTGSISATLAAVAALEANIRKIVDEADQRKKALRGENAKQVANDIDEETGRRIDAEKRAFNARKDLEIGTQTPSDKYFRDLAGIEDLKKRNYLNDYEGNRLTDKARTDAYGKGEARDPFKFGRGLFTDIGAMAGRAGGNLGSNLLTILAGVLTHRAVPAEISTALPTLQSSGTGLAESARDRLGLLAADDRREAARIRKKQAEDVEKMKKALEYIRDQIANGNPGNVFTALFAPR